MYSLVYLSNYSISVRIVQCYHPIRFGIIFIINYKLVDSVPFSWVPSYGVWLSEPMDSLFVEMFSSPNLHSYYFLLLFLFNIKCHWETYGATNQTANNQNEKPKASTLHDLGQFLPYVSCRTSFMLYRLCRLLSVISRFYTTWSFKF